MTRFEDMTASDLRAELADWTEKLEMYASEHLAAVESGDVDWERNMRVALKDAISRRRLLKRLLRLGVAA